MFCLPLERTTTKQAGVCRALAGLQTYSSFGQDPSCTSFVSAAPVRVGCFLPLPDALGLASVLPFHVFWSALVGRLSVLECAFWGVPLLLVLLHLFLPLRLFVTHPQVPPTFSQAYFLHVLSCASDLAFVVVISCFILSTTHCRHFRHCADQRSTPIYQD